MATRRRAVWALVGLLGLSVGGAARAGLYDSTVTADSPVAYWRLGEALGSPTVFNFLNPLTYQGTVVGGVTLGQPGAPVSDPDTAALFNGSNGKIDVPFDAALNPASFTIECWARVAGGVGSYRSPLSSRHDSPQSGYIFYAASNNRWEFWSGPGWHTLSGPGVALNDWVHLVGTYDAATQTKQLYVNGALVASATGVTVNVNPARPLRIGAGNNETAGNYWFNGTVDDVAVYNTVLTGDRIAEHYRVGQFGATDPMRDLFFADFSNPGVGTSGLPLGADASRMVAAGVTGSSPTRLNPDGVLLMSGGGSGGWVFVDELPDFSFDDPLVVQTQAFYYNHDAPASPSNAFFGLIALHQKGTGSSGADRRGGAWFQFEPYTNGTGRMRIGYQTDSTAGGDVWVDSAFILDVSGFSNANGLFDLAVLIGGLADTDPLEFTVTQGEWSATISTTIGDYLNRLLTLSPGAAYPAFLQTLTDLRGDPTAMNVGILSTSARVDAYNYLYVTGHMVPEPASLALLGLGIAALAARRRRRTARRAGTRLGTLATLALALSVIGPGVADAGLIAYWGLDEISGKVLDFAGAPYTDSTTGLAAANYGQASVPAGTYGAITVTAQTAAALGTAVNIPGSPLYLGSAAGSEINLTGDFTIMGWMYPTTVSGGKHLIFGTGQGGVNGWKLGLNNNRLEFTANGVVDITVPTANYTAVANQWIHYAVTATGTSGARVIRFYVNGTEVYAASANDIRLSTHTNMALGSAAGGSEAFQGRLDEVRLYDEIFSAAQIQAAAIAAPFIAQPAPLTAANFQQVRITQATDIINQGDLLAAISFGAASGVGAAQGGTINGIVFTALAGDDPDPRPLALFAPAGFENDTFGSFDATTTFAPGSDLDNVLSGLVVLNNTAGITCAELTLRDLTVGDIYRLQWLSASDTQARGLEFTDVLDGSTLSVTGLLNAVGPTNTVIEFVADSTIQRIFVRGSGDDPLINALVLQRIGTIPEPASLAVLGLGIAALAARRRRRNNR